MSEDAVKVFTNKLMDWQRQGYYVLLNNFYNMKGKSEKYDGFVVSANAAEQKFVWKVYVNKVLDERIYSFDQVNEMIEEMDKVVMGG